MCVNAYRWISFLFVDGAVSGSFHHGKQRSNGKAQEGWINKPFSIMRRSFYSTSSSQCVIPIISKSIVTSRRLQFLFLSIYSGSLLYHPLACESDFGMCLRLCGDDTEGARSQEEVSLVLWRMVWGISTELARGCKTIAKDSIGFEVSLCSWIPPYPILTGGSLGFNGLYRLRCLYLSSSPHPKPVHTHIVASNPSSPQKRYA